MRSGRGHECYGFLTILDNVLTIGESACSEEWAGRPVLLPILEQPILEQPFPTRPFLEQPIIEPTNPRRNQS